MQRLEVNCAVRRRYTSLGAKGLNKKGRNSYGCAGSVGWIDMAQDRDQWLPLVNKVTKLLVPENTGE